MPVGFMNMPDVKMTFMEHLGELRKRIIRSVIAIAVCAVAGYAFNNQVFQLLRKPLGQDVPIQYISPLEPFLTRLSIAFYVGVFLALPVVLYQALMFVIPALKPRERRVVLGGLLSSSVLTIAGLTVAFIGILPIIFPVMSSFAPEGVEAHLRLEYYVNVVFKFLIAFAVGFQFPIVMVSLVHLGIVPVRFFARNAKYVLVIILIVSALFTPPDPISQIMMAVPLFCLYVLSLGVAYLFRKRES
jgi:sec-independent protein translocase protein TatC